MNTGIRYINRLTLVLLCFVGSITTASAYVDSLANKTLVHKKTIREGLSPKSVVYSGNGLFFAQNMMYRHTVTVYNRDFELVKTIKDQITPHDFGIDQYGESSYRGAPVEVAFSHRGTYAWVTNYQMYGDSMSAPGCDGCAISQKYDKSFVYKINTSNFKIEKIIEVGSVPKYIAATPNDRYVLVSNWSSGDLSVIDVATSAEIKRISLGRYPRGIVIDQASKFAYVALMGSNKIARIDLDELSLSWFEKIGRTPRHLCLDGAGKFLYASLNNAGKIVKIDVKTGLVVSSVRSGQHPRSMVLSSNDEFIYAVNYFSDSVSKIDVGQMEVVERVKTKSKPIGITFDDRTNQVWVACYSGALMVFEETAYKPLRPLRFGNNSPLMAMEQRGACPNVKQGCFGEGHFRNFIQKENQHPELDVPPLIAEVEAIVVEELPVLAVAETVSVEESQPEPVVIAAPVLETEPEVKAQPETPKSTFEPVAGKKAYYIIGGSFRSLDNAKKMKGQLAAKGYTSVVIERTGKLHLVAFGAYPTPEEAQSAIISIQATDEPDAWVYVR